MLAFKRGLHGCVTQAKEAAAKSAAKGMKELRGAQTIYNARTSASNYKGYLKAKVPAGMYYNPAQSSVMGSINSETIPQAFMAKDDPRRQFVSQLRPNDAAMSRTAPPVLCSQSTLAGEKKYHLSAEQISEIVHLRASNPEVYSRKKLAKQFNVSPLFISMVSSASKERKAEMAGRLDTIKAKWHKKRALARRDREKRQELWYRA